MLFGFDVIELFGDGVCVLDDRMTPILVEHSSPEKNGYTKTSSSPRRGRHDAVRLERMYNVIDKMGEASAKAQGLHAPITCGERLAISSHHLYIMVDRKTNSDRGSVVGLLKVGHKTLFVYDRQNRQREMFPLCVLDFYVHESRQRTGCGKKLFDCMLRRERVHPEHLAIDRPSHKFSSFLRKHYNLKAVIPQVNNFVVFEGFFVNRIDDGMKRVGTAAASRPPAHNRVRPFSHYDRVTRSPYAEHPSNEVQPQISARTRNDPNDFTGLDVRRNQYNISERLQPEVLPILKPELRSQPDIRPDFASRPEIGPDFRSKSEMEPEELRQRPSFRVTSRPPEGSPYGVHVPKIETPEPVRDRNTPCRPRDGPSSDYKHFVSQLNNDYLDRRGRLVVSDSPGRTPIIADTRTSPIAIQPIPPPPQRESPYHQPRSLPAGHSMWRDATSATALPHTDERCRPAQQTTSWTMFGSPPNYQGRKWQHTKLW